MSSPWSRDAPPTIVTLPPSILPPTSGMVIRAPRRWPWALAALLVVAGLSAGVSFCAAYVAMGDNTKQAAPTRAPQPSATPQFSTAEVAESKRHLCQAFDISVRGQGGQGGLRVDGQLNVPMVLRSLNSATAVQNALVPAVPRDVAAAAKSYVSATLDQTTAAMGNTPTSEVNRLTDLRNEAGNALLDACGIPR